ncbi:hypothetical protein PILCRDRAFT_821467 [Piloderma croceum F 1598]|uniref:Uncharacterized protein n=1 Tax=Piloderma croceum (strain F 1598) TaxID=765440 RepID=A0A0C3F9P8_PILCF|nr:hypothetical protein PILCRDRAFT_821467 [Piloderma croceum F 1598]
MYPMHFTLIMAHRLHHFRARSTVSELITIAVRPASRDCVAMSSSKALVGHTTIITGSIGNTSFPIASVLSAAISRTTSINRVKNPVLPDPVGVVASKLKPSITGHTPSDM